MTLAEFLLARIAEDEAAVRATGYFTGKGEEWWGEDWYAACGREITAHLVRWEPPRVLAECEAQRRLVESATYWQGLGGAPDSHGDGRATGFMNALRLLALPHADHPDYRDEWRP